MIIGYGVLTRKHFCNKDFLLQYPGPLLSNSEGRRLEESYPTELGSLIFFHGDKWWVCYFLLGLSLLLLDISQNLLSFVTSLASEETENL